MTELGLADIWTAGGVVLGFQATALSWRIAKEAQSEAGTPVWLAPADYLNLLANAVMVFGVFIGTALEAVGVGTAIRMFGLSTLLYLGHGAALAAHYELFNPKSKRSFRWFPPQERVAIAAILGSTIVYLVLALS